MESVASSQRGSFIAKLGAWLQLAQLIGMGGTVVGMMKAFGDLKTSGASDPEILSGAIGEVLITTAVGFAISIVGLVLVTIAISACHYRAVWMFWFLCIYGELLIFYLFPFGLFFLIFALVKKDEFLKTSEQTLAA
ncbi:MotA/TolQ/ExbB proton channel family protein [Prosthecobacter sp.]|uniref:MotA/TolQ/ExbB proton channel family protein n=1 Tax=Prosthecobacter sp. TaxID=1965333 RepID=UPI001DFD1BC6|nr:MotA/TolQ/ExbB proton channel family protein [Prosthecobacter sp.]MCB1279468.1 MotA/TolQ/ExbB proton channel family protein [Prosthecobacter sp.]